MKESYVGQGICKLGIELRNRDSSGAPTASISKEDNNAVSINASALRPCAMSDKTFTNHSGESYSGVVPAKYRTQSRERGSSGLERLRQAAKDASFDASIQHPR
jgi:hypothetical protein